MSQDYNISGYLNVQVPFRQIDTEFWGDALFASVTDPKQAMEKGIDSVPYVYSDFKNAEIYKSQAEENEFDDQETEAGAGAIVDVTRFEFAINKTLSCYSVDDYLADVTNSLYLFARSQGVRISFSADHTYLNRGPDDTVSYKWSEMTKKFAESA